MKSEIKIGPVEKGIPIPKKTYNTRKLDTLALSKLEVGDSLVIEVETDKGFRARVGSFLVSAHKTTGRKFSCRKLKIEDDKASFRIWRVE